MKQKDIEVGGRYWTNVGETRVEVVVVGSRVDHWSGRTKFQVKRADNGVYLPKWRSSAALHRSDGSAYWPSMTERQD